MSLSLSSKHPFYKFIGDRKMLYLWRRKNQEISVIHKATGEELKLIVLEVDNKVVKLGFENDERTFTILRKEIKQANEGVENPNPFYKDQLPPYYFNKEQVNAAVVQTPMATLESLVDSAEGSETIEEVKAEAA